MIMANGPLSGLADWSKITPEQLLRGHLARPKNTSRAYAAAISTFCLYLREGGGGAEEVTPAEAVRYFVGLPRGSAKLEMDSYLQWLRDNFEAINSVRTKAQSLMGLLKRAHEYEIIPWMLQPLGLPSPDPIRDTRGPSREQVKAILKLCGDRGDGKGARDEAMVALMAFGAYRCNEVLTLDVKHVNIPSRELEVLSKGLWGRIRYPIPMVAAEAIERWLTYRGYGDGPLFTRKCSPAENPSRLTYDGAYHAVSELERRVGALTGAHRFRHFATTSLLAQTDGRIPWAMALTRHRDPKTLMIYNDERLTRAREAMELVASGVAHYRMKERTTDNF